MHQREVIVPMSSGLRFECALLSTWCSFWCSFSRQMRVLLTGNSGADARFPSESRHFVGFLFAPAPNGVQGVAGRLSNQLPLVAVAGRSESGIRRIVVSAVELAVMVPESRQAADRLESVWWG